jgi:hypothetical protein
MYPFECSKCRKVVHAPSKRLAECCPNATMTPMVNICLLLHKDIAPTHKVVHTVAPTSIMRAMNGAECVTACNASSLPKVTTSFLVATTCYKCLQWYKANSKQMEINKELEGLEALASDVEFVDEENPENSFKKEVSKIRERVSKPSFESENVEDIYEQIKNLHEKMKVRKIIQTKHLMKEFT